MRSATLYPMRLASLREPFDHRDWIFELKYDGFRSLAFLEANQDAALSQWRLEVERSQYEAERAERRYRTVDPENRLVARGLETEWENRLRELSAAEAELQRRFRSRLAVIETNAGVARNVGRCGATGGILGVACQPARWQGVA